MKLIKIAFLVAMTVAFASCAQKNEDDYNQLEQASLDAWMKINQPTAELLSSGVYIKRIVSNPTAKRVNDNDWVMINYTGTTLGGDVYCTRYKWEAEIEGTFTNKTHYVPQYMGMYKSNYGMIQAQYDALKTMQEGDSVALYIPSRHGYGSSGSSFTGGFAGQTALSGGVSSILYLRLVKVVEKPIEYENGLVEDYAVNVLKLASKADSLKDHLYLSRYDTVDCRTLTENQIKLIKIGQDSTVKVWYKGYYLDGFVFDTNIDSVAQRVWQDWETKTALSYKPSSDNMIAAFKEVVPNMRMGDRARFVFSSTWGYGAAGSDPIPSYSPLVFDIFVETSRKTTTTTP